MRYTGVAALAGLLLPQAQAGYYNDLHTQKTLVVNHGQSYVDQIADSGYTDLTAEWERPAPGPNGKKPNIIFILTDDQDLHMNSLDYIPLIRKHLIEKGTLYTRHYCTTAICCPARVSLLTGRLAHNTNVTDVNPPHGRSPFSREQWTTS